MVITDIQKMLILSHLVSIHKKLEQFMIFNNFMIYNGFLWINNNNDEFVKYSILYNVESSLLQFMRK